MTVLETPKTSTPRLVTFNDPVQASEERETGRQHEDFGPARPEHDRVGEERGEHQSAWFASRTTNVKTAVAATTIAVTRAHGAHFDSSAVRRASSASFNACAVEILVF